MARYPSLFQINTRVWLTALAGELGRPATLDDVPDAELDRLARMGFDWVWLLSVWQTGAAGQRVSRSNPEWRHEFEETLPDLARRGHRRVRVSRSPATRCIRALVATRRSLAFATACASADLKLMLDFVPNHTALDHPWVQLDPEYYISGTEADLEREPQNYTRVVACRW